MSDTYSFNRWCIIHSVRSFCPYEQRTGFILRQEGIRYICLGVDHSLAVPKQLAAHIHHSIRY